MVSHVQTSFRQWQAGSRQIIDHLNHLKDSIHQIISALMMRPHTKDLFTYFIALTIMFLPEFSLLDGLIQFKVSLSVKLPQCIK